VESEAAPNVLLVEPEGHVLASLQQALSSERCRPVPAHNGEVARTWAEGMEPDLVIADVESPRSGGLELLSELRALHPDTVLVVLAPPDAAGVDLAALGRAGIYRVLPKPWNDEELRFTVRLGLHYRDLLRKSRLLQKRVDLRLEEWRKVEVGESEGDEEDAPGRAAPRPLVGAYPKAP
jgi:DNA-binding response OmpR family regulator